MRFVSTLSAAVFLLSSSVSMPVLADDLTAASALTSATVYANRAKLSRRAVVEVPAGAHKIVFEGLPTIMMTDSIRVEGSAAADVQFGSVVHKMVHAKELVSEKEREIQKQIDKLNQDKREVDAEKEAARAKKTFLNNIGRQAKMRSDEAIAELNLHADQWVSAGDALSKGLGEAQKVLVALDVKTRDLDKAISKLRRDLNQFRNGAKSTYTVTVPLESSAATKLSIDLSYQVSHATWRPIYDARLDTASGDLELMQYGVVSQQTGEDWADVAVTLSTAQPHRNATLGELGAQWVDVYQARNMQKSSMMGGAMPQSMGMLADSAYEMDEEVASAPMRLREKKEKRASFQTAEIVTGGFVSEYRIVGKSDVASDGSESKLAIGAYELESELQIHVRPVISSDAFIAAHTKLTGEAPVLAGDVSLFRDGAYIGQSYMPMLSPKEEHDFYFGIDDMVSVERDVLKDERADEGMIMREDVLERHYVTTIHNMHKDKMSIVMQDRIPTSRNENIRVEVLRKVTTAGYEQDVNDVKGLMQWDMDLSADEASRVKLGYKVSWPKGESLSGL